MSSRLVVSYLSSFMGWRVHKIILAWLSIPKEKSYPPAYHIPPTPRTKELSGAPLRDAYFTPPVARTFYPSLLLPKVQGGVQFFFFSPPLLWRDED